MPQRSHGIQADRVRKETAWPPVFGKEEENTNKKLNLIAKKSFLIFVV